MLRIRFVDLLKIVLALALLASLLAVLLPVAAGAAGQLFTIVDSDSNVQAQVDGGKLRVGDGAGKLTVDGTIVERETMRGRAPYQVTCGFSEPNGDSVGACSLGAVPAGKSLVLTHVSGYLVLPPNQPIRHVALLLSTAENELTLYLNELRSVTAGSFTRTTIAQPVDVVTAAGDEIEVHALREVATGTMTGAVVLYGYLVDAT